MSDHSKGPLAGLRVIELTKVWAGPYTGRLLACMGAEVIRVESLGSLDVTRFYGVKDINKAPGFLAVNQEKLSVQIDMKSAEGLALLLDLIGKSDILIENLRPGAVDRLGVGYAQAKAANPEIIYVSMGMYGSDGPLAYQTGYAPCFAALGGLTAQVGYPGTPPRGMNVRYADSSFGAYAALAALAGLAHRKSTGEGQFIDVSAVECMSTMVGDSIMAHSLNGNIVGAEGNRHSEMAPHGLYRCEDDDWIAIAVENDAQWAVLAGMIGLAEPRYATLAGRKADELALDEAVGKWTASQSAVELAEKLQLAGVAAIKSQNSLDLISDAHLWGRGFYPDVTEADGKQRPIVGPSWRMNDTTIISRGSPTLGQHNAEVLGGILEISEEDRQTLAEKGITR